MSELLFEHVKRCIEAGKRNHEIVMVTGCSVSYIRYVKRYMNDPQKMKRQNKSRTITNAWKKKFSEEWEKEVRELNETHKREQSEVL